MCYNGIAMKSIVRNVLRLLLLLQIGLLGCYGAVGCAGRAASPAGDPAGGAPEEPAAGEASVIATAEELAAFFEEGTGDIARLSGDIDMGDTMLKLESGRGRVALIGGGHTLSGSAPCVIRLADGCEIALQDITIAGEKTGVGLLKSGSIKAANCAIEAGGNGIEAAGLLLIEADSSLSVTSREGSGILSLGVSVMERSVLQVQAQVFAIGTGRGDIALQAHSKVSCEAYGDNAVKTDGTLVLWESSTFSVKNPGEHNAAKVGSLQAMPDAKLELTGGENGVGLFIVEQTADVTLKGYCRPADVRVEAGKGIVAFTA